jgi:transcriptional regulator with XRE-family HTH domain
MDIPSNLSREQVKAIKEIGHSLKEKRENLNYTLDYVSEVIRISVHTIQQLEEGNYSFFRNMVFLKGSLRNYCNFIKIDPSALLEKIDQIFAEPTVAIENVDVVKENFVKSAFFVQLIVSFAIISLLGVGIYFFFFYDFGGKNNEIIELEQEQKVEPLVEEPKEQELVLSLSANQDGWARISANKTRVFEIYLKKRVEYSWVVKENFELVLATRDLANVFLNKRPAILLLEKEKDAITVLNFNSF